MTGGVRAVRLACGIAACAVAACGVPACSSSAATAPADGPLAGRWGGPQAQLVVEDGSARVELSCAAGRIEGPIRLEQGRFDGSGPWWPGPVPSIHPRVAYYSGLVAGSRIELTIVVAPDGPTHGPLALERGRDPTFPRCQ